MIKKTISAHCQNALNLEHQSISNFSCDIAITESTPSTYPTNLNDISLLVCPPTEIPNDTVSCQTHSSDEVVTLVEKSSN